MSDTPFSALPAVDFSDDIIFGVAAAGISSHVTGEALHDAWGFDRLGSTKLTAAAHESAVVTLEWPPGSGLAPTHETLIILVNIVSYGGSPDPSGDIASLRFNGDTGANYWSRHIYYDAGIWNDVPQASATLIRLAETNSRLSRNVFVEVNNNPTRGKTCNIKNQTGTANAALVGSPNVGGGEWVNLVDRIATVQLVDAGSNNMGNGSGMFILGLKY